jgi:tetraacyldisaccharide 4'-kinase
VNAASGRSLPVENLEGMRVACFAGIAHPDRFFADVEASGARVVARLPYRDHHAYSGADLDRIRSEASRAGAALLLTTMKDLARLGPGALPDLHALAQELEVDDADRFAALVVEVAS